MSKKSNGEGVTLTLREQEVLRLLVNGFSNEAAAEVLDISVSTVQAHRARIMLKLDKHDLPALVKYAITTGLTTVAA